MKAVLILMAATFSVAVFGQEVAAPSSMDMFISEWYWALGGLIIIFEYLVGASKLESNSTIDILLNFLKMLNPKK
jgi:hypothetical protein